MDWIDDALTEYFAAATAPAGVARRLASRRAVPATLDALADRLEVAASERGVVRVGLGAGGAHGPRRLVERARQELTDYLAGRRTFFSVPLDLAGVPPFQARVLAAAGRIPFGEVVSYAGLAARIGHPRAARAVGNALAANPVPLLLPCHRVIRGDGTWGHYALGAGLKTRLLQLEQRTPALVGCTTTGIVCRRGCPHEQRMRDDHRVVFASLDDARQVGYRGCRACRPAAV
jgi:methylated-DNA-[protein]-cysteine S-methyltransferase